MKKTITLALALLFTACGNKSTDIDALVKAGDLKQLRALKQEETTQLNATKAKINVLDEAIAQLDNNKGLSLITSFVAAPERFEHFITVQADMKTRKNVALLPEFSGSLLRFHVAEGQKVKKGTLLATLDDGGLEQQLEQLKLQLALAKTTFERSQRLWDQKIGSEIQFLEAKTRYESQEKMVEQMQAQLAKTKVFAPFNGTVDELLVNEGANVIPGRTPILRIVNLNSMYAEAQLPERYLSKVQKGTPVLLEMPMLEAEQETQIQTLGNFINPSNRTFRVEAPLQNTEGKIKPNLMGKMKINDYSNPAALMIPQHIVRENTEGKSYIFTLKETATEGVYIAQRQFITLGQVSEDKVEVVAGIKIGDRIVDEGANSIEDQQRVRNLN
jgi:membrane fusion protein (multidrug efflux system)